MNAICPIDHDPIEIDPRPCEWCGLTIDQHHMVDDGEGPEFFCEEMPWDYAADLVRGWQLADGRDAWRVTGEAPPPANVRNSDISTKPIAPRLYRTPQSTIDAFLHVARNESTAYLADWLARHPLDAPHLQKIGKEKCTARST
jgi:hypothetical protein